MKIPCLVLPSADRDLDLEADYLADEAGIETALRFLAAAQKTFSSLAAHPGLGWRPSLGPAFQSIRAFPVAGFKSMLVFYRTREDVLEIVRVLHGARDLEALFRKESVDGAEQ